MTSAGNVARYGCPNAWLRIRHFRIALSLVILVGGGLFLCWYGLVGVSDLAWTQVGFGILGGVGFIGMGAYEFRAAVWGMRSTNAQIGPETWVSDCFHAHVPRSWAWIEFLALAAWFVSGVLFCAGVWLELFRPILTDGQRLFVPLAVMLLAVGSCYGAWFKWMRMSRGLLLLTDASISVADSVSVRTVDWADVTDVAPVGGKERKQTRSAIVIGQRRGRSISILADELAVGAPAAFWLIDFYWRHPELRSELSTTRVLERLQDGTLAEDIDRYV